MGNGAEGAKAVRRRQTAESKCTGQTQIESATPDQWIKHQILSQRVGYYLLAILDALLSVLASRITNGGDAANTAHGAGEIAYR